MSRHANSSASLRSLRHRLCEIATCVSRHFSSVLLFRDFCFPIVLVDLFADCISDCCFRHSFRDYFFEICLCDFVV